jgi:hypothetical protein
MMTRLQTIIIWLVVVLLGMPAAVIATEAGPLGSQPTVTQEPHPQSGATQGATSASKEKTAKKSHQEDVQSRGLFKKKKKKQKSGAAGHSQPSESGDLGVESGASR